VRFFLVPHSFPAADSLVRREAEVRDKVFLGGKPQQGRSMFAQDHIHCLDAETVDRREVDTAHAVERVARGLFPALFDRPRFVHVRGWGRRVVGLCHGGKVSQDFTLVLGQAVGDRDVHLQTLLQAEEIIDASSPSIVRDFGLRSFDTNDRAGRPGGAGRARPPTIARTIAMPMAPSRSATARWT
jgi:hypothetical protein